MLYRPLGNTGLRVSELSLGAARGATDTPDEFIAAVHTAIDQGINLIDTAQHYDDSEATLGRALQGHDDILVQTKYLPYASFAPDAKYTGSPADLIAACEQSCQRLKRDHLDIFLGHGMRTLASYHQFMNDGCYDAMLKLKQQGKVRHIGISELSEADGQHAVLREAVPSGAFDVVMLTVNLLLQTAIDDLLPLCSQHGVGTVVMMPLNQASGASGLVSQAAAKETIRRMIDQGVLPGKPPYTDEDLFDFLSPWPIPQAAIRYVLAQEVSTCCVGARKPSRILENVQAASRPYLTDAQLTRARQLFARIHTQVR